MLETTQPTAQTDAQSLIQVRGRLRERIDFIAYSQNAVYPFFPSIINYTLSGMTGILITIQGISHCWVIDGPDVEKYGCLRVTFIRMPNKDLWSFLN
jgi:hypothetical protein